MNFLKTYKMLFPILLFTALLLAARMMRTHSLKFVFIPWNLFLAVIPLYFSYLLNTTGNKITGGLLFFAWLVFFPNAMYIVTDLFHLQKLITIPEWYDLLILFTAAIAGVIMGYLSLQNAELFLARHFSRKRVSAILFVIFVLCGYGIYLGRYLRWNSWDILADPFSLMEDVKYDAFHPFHNKECWLLTILFGVWMQLLYHYFKKLKITNYHIRNVT